LARSQSQCFGEDKDLPLPSIGRMFNLQRSHYTDRAATLPTKYKETQQSAQNSIVHSAQRFASANLNASNYNKCNWTVGSAPFCQKMEILITF